jgi:hypothetical protein
MVEKCIVNCVLAAAILFASTGSADIYKCKTENGILYSETKCADDSSIELNLEATSFYNKDKSVNRDEGNLLIEKTFGKVLDFSKKNVTIQHKIEKSA